MFPGRLHELLEYVEGQNMDHIVSWCRNGTGFMVHRPDELLQLLSFFFGQTKYRSFTRQLSTWFFEREEHGPFKGAYHHPYFIKNDKGLFARMSRNGPPDSRLYARAVDQLAFGNTEHQILQKKAYRRRRFVHRWRRQVGMLLAISLAVLTFPAFLHPIC